MEGKMNTCWKILVFVSLLAMLVSGCSTQASPSPTPTMGPVDAIRAFEDAVNRHDVQGAIARLTEDVSFSEEGNWEFTSRQDVQTSFEFTFALPIEVHYTDCQPPADTVSCKMTYADTCTRAYGMNPIPGDASFTIVKDKIKKIVWKLDAAAEQKMTDNSAKFGSWFEKTYPDEYKWSDENWLTKENGILQNKRCQEYGATLK
jgi:hypothetical protein